MDEWTKNSGKSAVIMQMMKKMGYVQGKGLGVKQQGIVEPVAAKLRSGRTALGYQKDEQVEEESKFRVYSKKDEQMFGTLVDNDYTIHASVKQTWKKSGLSKENTRHAKLEDILDDEILYQGKRQRHDPEVQPYGKIIDLTGPAEKVYEDFTSYYEHVNSRESIQQDAPGSTSKMIDLIEKEIRKNGRELQFLKEQTHGLSEDRDNLDKEISLGRADLLRMEEMMRIIQRSLPVLTCEPSALEECRILFSLLKRDFPIECKLFGVDSLVVANILPVFKSTFTRWMPGDRSAIEAILPIVPKLERALQTINIHTTEKFFYANLCSKLSSPDASVTSVKEYYADWKNLFPDHFISMKSFRDELTRALVAINQVQSGSVLTPISLPRCANRITSSCPRSQRNNSFSRHR
uniref:G-patch domain-containing protein n=1 Tax=Ditylenchus dipsaci TaxID=166011 RepID=A0A915DPA7_9BILA